MAERFGRALWGYSPRRVREAMRVQQTRYEGLLMEKQERLTALRDENLVLRQQLESLEQRQQDVAMALVEAQIRARAILEGARTQSRTEQQQAREIVSGLEAQAQAQRQALAQAAANVERMARDFSHAAQQQIRMLTLPEDRETPSGVSSRSAG